MDELAEQTNTRCYYYCTLWCVQSPMVFCMTMANCILFSPQIGRINCIGNVQSRSSHRGITKKPLATPTQLNPNDQLISQLRRGVERSRTVKSGVLCREGSKTRRIWLSKNRISLPLLDVLVADTKIHTK